MGLNDLACFATVVVQLEAHSLGCYLLSSFSSWDRMRPLRLRMRFASSRPSCSARAPPSMASAARLLPALVCKIALTGISDPYTRAYRYGRLQKYQSPSEVEAAKFGNRVRGM